MNPSISSLHHLIIQLWKCHDPTIIPSISSISWTWINRTKKTFSPLRKVKHAPWHLHSLHGESTANQFRALSSCSDWPWQGQFPTSAPEELMGGNCLMSFFHFPPKKNMEHQQISDHWGVVCFQVSTLKTWEHCTCKILETPKPCENKLAESSSSLISPGPSNMHSWCSYMWKHRATWDDAKTEDLSV